MKDPLKALSGEKRDKLRKRKQPSWTNPMLATLTHKPFSDEGWIYERKLDGERCLAFRKGRQVHLRSRNKERLNKTYHRRTKGEAFLEQACEKGWEGVIAKKADSRYTHSRSRDWLKFKCEKQQEFVIAGYTNPKGSRIGFGALLIGCYDGNDLKYAGMVGTGFDDELLERLGKRLSRIRRKSPAFADEDKLPAKEVHWTAPKLVAQVAFTEWTDGKLRHPRFLGLRRGKKPREVVRELAKG